MSDVILDALFEALDRYPNAKNVTPKLLAGYAADLDDLPEPLVVRAIEELRRASTFFPALAEIRKTAIDIAGDGVIVDAEVAWGEVMRNVTRFGLSGTRVCWAPDGVGLVRESLVWSSPLIERAIEAFGWRELCMLNPEKPDDVNTARAQFRDTLEAIQGRAVRDLVSGRAQARPALAGGAGNAIADRVASVAASKRMEE